MDSILKDLRYAVRMLLKTPMFSLIAVLTLAIGIGANTAIFTLVNAVLIRPIAVGNPQGLVLVGNPSRANSFSFGSPRIDIFSYPQYKLFREQNRVFTELYASGVLRRVDVIAENGERNGEPAFGYIVTGNYFPVLEVKPILGRTFGEAEDRQRGGAPVVVLSYGAWKRRFNLDPNIVGRTLRLNGFPFTVIGVMPAEFNGDTVGRRAELWVPMSMQEQILPSRKWLDDAHVSWLHLMGRLKPGVTLAQARQNSAATMKQIGASQWAAQFLPDELRIFGKDLNVQSGALGFSGARDVVGTPLLILMGIVAVVLLIACVNVASLLLARAWVRRREIAVRLALGASPGRIVRQLLTESMLLSAVGGLAGMLVATWGTHLLTSARGTGLADILATNSVDWRVLGFTAAVCVVTGVLFGLAPALQAIRLDLGPTLKEGVRTTSGSAGSKWSLGRLLVAGQVALSVLVLFVAGLLVRSLQKLQDVDLGYSREKLLVVNVDPTTGGYTTAEQARQLVQRLQDAVAAVPGVSAATASENGLFSGTESANGIVVQGFTAARDADNISAMDSVAAGYFTALRVPILLGRDIGPQDTASSQRVAVVNESMMKFYFKGENPLGRTIAIDDPKEKTRPFVVIGVARDIHDHDVRDKVERRFYIPITQETEALTTFSLEVRTLADPSAITESVRKAIAAVDSNVPILRVATLDSMVDQTLSAEQVVANVSSFFGGIVLLLASVGLYGIMAYTVAGRTREIGVRMALGAQRGDVLWMVLREALILVALGVAAGVPAAILASRAMRSLLFGLHTVDPVALAVTVLLLALVAGLAGFLPARRATKVDPMAALRYE